MHEKMHVKTIINEKERVIWTYRLGERKTLQNFGGKQQKFDVEPSPNWREREKSLRAFEK